MLEATMWLFAPGGKNNWLCRWVCVLLMCRWVCILLMCRSPALNINEFHIRGITLSSLQPIQSASQHYL